MGWLATRSTRDIAVATEAAAAAHAAESARWFSDLKGLILENRADNAQRGIEQHAENKAALVTLDNKVGRLHERVDSIDRQLVRDEATDTARERGRDRRRFLVTALSTSGMGAIVVGAALRWFGFWGG